MASSARFASALGLVFAFGMGLPHPAGADQPAPDAAELVRGVIALENKIHEFPSLRIHVRGKGQLSPRALAQAKARRAKGLPGVDPRGAWTSEGELLFDAERIYTRWDSDGHTSATAWDGKTAGSYTHDKSQPTGSAGIATSLDRGVYVVGCLDWLQVGKHAFWWSVRRKDEEPLRAEEFVLAGEEPFRGQPCYRLDSPARLRRLYVGKADGRLYGFVIFHPPSDEEELALASRIAGHTLASREELTAWMAKLPEARRRQFQLDLERQRFAMPLASSLWFFDDYVQYAPGFWVPRHFGVDFTAREGKQIYPFSSTEVAVVNLEVNPQLAGEQFDVAIPEGTKVWDTRHDPPLYYSYKKHFTDAEWQAIVDAKRREVAAEESRARMQRARVGQVPPPLPEAEWFNTDPVKWDSLRGKVVLLEFFSESCGPCRNDVERLRQLHQQRDRSGIVALGVHAIGSQHEAIQKFVELLEIEYPICVHVDDTDQRTMGPFYRWFAVDGIPHTAVVDRDGKVAATGTLDEVLPVARRLAKAK